MTETPQIGHNNPPEDEKPSFEMVKKAIDDLFDEAVNFCDGEPIESQEMADALTDLQSKIHETGKLAESMRVAEKKPFDDGAKAVQEKYNPLVGKTKGKVDKAKSACQALLTPWRNKLAAEAAAEARRKEELARKEREEADRKIRESRDNLAARIEAEDQLAHAKSLEAVAAKTWKKATTGTGLRVIHTTEIVDNEKALDWAFGVDSGAFIELALSMARSRVSSGARELPGFKITESKVAR